jgi:hypothetical protein
VVPSDFVGGAAVVPAAARRTSRCHIRRLYLVCQSCVVPWLGHRLREGAAGGRSLLVLAPRVDGVSGSWRGWLMARSCVSSTIVDLKRERRAVLEWLGAARHQAVDSYLPDSDTVRASCLEDGGTCGLCVLILGHRYGFVPSEHNPEGAVGHASGVPAAGSVRNGLDSGSGQWLCLIA